MTITIGQYIPGNSLLHKADPRTKLIMTLFYMTMILLIKDFIGYAIAAAFLILTIVVTKIPVKMIIKGLKPIAFLVIFTMVLNILFYRVPGDPLVKFWIFKIYTEGILFSLRMAIRIVVLVSGASLLTYTTSSIALTDGIERLTSPLKKIGFPSHDIAMMMSIALRFIPTFAEEADRIMKAQSARGADFDSKKFMEKIKNYIPILVPLVVCAFKRATDLATAMEARCYRGGNGRTRFRILSFSKADLIILICCFIFGALIISERCFF